LIPNSGHRGKINRQTQTKRMWGGKENPNFPYNGTHHCLQSLGGDEIRRRLYSELDSMGLHKKKRKKEETRKKSGKRKSYFGPVS